MSSPPSTHPVHALSDTLVSALCEGSPSLATFAGVAGWDDRWDDFSPAGVDERRGRLEAIAAAHALLPPAASADDRLATSVIGEFLAERRSFFQSGDPWLDLNHITSPVQHIPMVFDVMDLDSASRREAIVSRLYGLPEALLSYRALLDDGAARGLTVARRQVTAALSQIRARTRGDGLFGELRARWGSVDPTFDRTAAAAAAAWVQLGDWLEASYLPRAETRDAVGADRYVRCARGHLGLELDAEALHAWGWEELAREEDAARREAETLFPGVSIAETARRLDADPAGRLDLPGPFLDAMRQRQATAMLSLDGQHFDLPDAVRTLDVKMAPVGGKPGAYYLGPSEDFSRVGCVWYSAGGRTSMPLWSEVTTAHHEGFPGHHLQLSLQLLHRDRLTRFQRVWAQWCGAAEGWALYAEQLMDELGFLDHPALRFGMRCAQIVRACRVIVDTGLHLELPIASHRDFHPGEVWNHSLAVEFMHDRAMLDPIVAESEVVRYLGWPGQAVAYKVGQRELLAIREARRAGEGASFDLRRFHTELLAIGNAPLSVIRAVMLGGAKLTVA